jgi:hypothetical protein
MLRFWLVRLRDNGIHCGRERLDSAGNVPKPAELDSIRIQHDYCRKLINLILIGELFVLADSFGRSLLRLIKVKFAEKEVVFRIVGKFSLVEDFAIQLEAGNAPVSAYECQKQRAVGLLGESG